MRIRSQVTGVDAAALGQRGGILVDEDLRTSVPDVFAVGDAAVKRDAFAGQGEPEPFALIPLALKLLVDPETDRILGAQGVGHDGVDKRIDVLATAIASGLTASDLADLELAYAPAYGSVRTSVEHARGTVVTSIDGADRHVRNVPLDELRARAHTEIPTDTPVVVHCQVGQRGHTAARLLTQLGYDVRNLDGGYLTWRDAVRATPAPAHDVDGVPQQPSTTARSTR